MKRFCIAILLSGLLLSCVACSSRGSGLETIPTDSGTTAPAVSDTTAPTVSDTTAPTDSDTEADTADRAPQTAPDFTVTDKDGKAVKLSDFFGKPIVLNFWASWCPPCKAELPDFEAACKKYEGEVTFLMVNLTDGQRETVRIALDFLNSNGYTFPVYFDTSYEASYIYGISSIPQTFFLDSDGIPVARATGMISAAQLEEGIGMILPE